MADDPPKVVPIRSAMYLLPPTKPVAASSSRLTPLLTREFPVPKAPRLIRGFAGRGERMLIYGDSYSGKSFFAVDLCLRMTHQMLWQGRETKAGTIIYVAGEAAASIHRRVIAWECYHNVYLKEDMSFGVIGCAPNLLSSDGHDIQGMIDACNKFADRCGLPLDLIMFDTLHAVAPGSREDSEDTSRVLDNTSRIQEATGGPTVGWLHHSGKNSGNGPRGSSSLTAAMDVSIEIVEELGCRQVLARKVRDAKLPDLEPFDIQNYVFARDDDTGEDIAAGVLVPAAVQGEDMTVDSGEQARIMRKAGKSLREIGATLGLSKSKVDRLLRGQQ